MGAFKDMRLKSLEDRRGVPYIMVTMKSGYKVQKYEDETLQEAIQRQKNETFSKQEAKVINENAKKLRVNKVLEKFNNEKKFYQNKIKELKEGTWGLDNYHDNDKRIRIKEYNNIIKNLDKNIKNLKGGR